MMSRIGHAVAAMAGAALLLASAPANAAGCWAKGDAAVAAKVRELQTMLMVGALRCRATGIDILPSYNAFVSTHRKTIAAMNDRLKAHFASSGPTEGQRRYDRYTTALANGYGAGMTGPESCAEMSDLAREARGAADAAELIALAERSVPASDPAGVCPTVLSRAGR